MANYFYKAWSFCEIKIRIIAELVPIKKEVGK